MAYNKLHKKDFTIAVKTGIESNKAKFAKECVKGEMYFATDSKKVYVANSDAGTLDASLTELSSAGQFDPSYELSQLGYSGGLFTSTNYTISTQPIMHFDAAILDGSDQANNPLNGVAVSTWGDRSGQGVNYDATQATGSAQPTFNVSGDDKYVSFDGGDFLDFTDYALPTAFNMVIVGNTNADANNFLPIGMNADSQYVILELGGTTYGISGNVVDNTYGPNYNSIQNFWATRDGSNNFNIYVQGGNSILSRSTATARTVSRLGKANNNFYHTGDIYELIIWNTDLSTADKNTINSYLANKYSSLPTLTAFA
jgi:hypothetical protein